MFSNFVANLKDITGIDPRVVSYYHPGAIVVEQYRNIRTYINSLSGGELLRSILISSASKAEGKSLTSVNLAVTMAEDKDKSVVIVDTDFRAPTVEALLNISNKKGLSNYLQGQIRLDEALTATAIPNLMVLPAGEEIAKPAELFAGQKMKDLIPELEKHFNYIILDTPALIPYADARILASYVDGVMLSVQALRTRREVVFRAQEQLLNVKAKLLGVILTQVEYHIPEYIHRHL